MVLGKQMFDRGGGRVDVLRLVSWWNSGDGPIGLGVGLWWCVQGCNEWLMVSWELGVVVVVGG